MPTQKPRPVFLRAGWYELIMANFVVPEAWLAPLCPSSVQLDTYRGKHYISLVAFLFRDTKVLGIPFPGHRHFPEVNLRFYVRRGDRRGTVFISEIVPKRMISWIANSLYNENYRTLPIEADPSLCPQTRSRLAFRWGHALENAISVHRFGNPALPERGSEAHFITEHYWGYNQQRNGSTMEYQVEHPAWRVWMAADHTLNCDFTALYGSPFSQLGEMEPASVLIAEGSPVSVRFGRRLPPDQTTQSSPQGTT